MNSNIPLEGAPKAKATTVLLCGVGGQGTILAAHVLAEVYLSQGFDVKVSEIHGMAQRGGSVTTVVRFGEQVNSMVADYGCAEVIVSFETTEALRNLPYLKAGGSLIVNDEAIKPLPVLTGLSTMPQNARADLVGLGARLIPSARIARNVGNAKTANVVLLGALSTALNASPQSWEQAIAKRVPEKTIDANINAFYAGREYIYQDERSDR